MALSPIIECLRSLKILKLLFKEVIYTLNEQLWFVHPLQLGGTVTLLA